MPPLFQPDIDNAPHCQSALLNGWWEFAPIYDQEKFDTLPSTYPERILVPSFWNTLPQGLAGDWGAYLNFEWPEKWNEARAAAHRVEFALPSQPRGRVLRLRFDAVLARAEVFVNRTRVLQIEDGFLPHEADITSAVHWNTTNTLEVLVREHPKMDGLFLRPAGSWVGWNLRGIWQDCSLRLEPAVRIADIAVRPSVRNGALEVLTTVQNASGIAQGVSIAHRVTGEEIRFGTGFQSIQPGETVVIRSTTEWKSPELWSPDSPHLYWLESMLAGGDGGREALDSRKTRFGFKEFWIEGTGFVLNGKPIRFKGDSWHYMGAVQQTPEYARQWFTMVKAIGGNAVRLHAMPHPEFYLDLADEMGICIIDESAVYGSGGNLALKENEFWDYAREHVWRLAQRDRNHPSVCLWSACNEVVWRGGEESFPKLLSLENAIHEVDPTRPVSYDENNSDLGGGAKIYGGHYGNTAAWAQHWKRNKPLMVNEFSALYYSGPEDPSLWGGEACYADFDARTRGAGMEASETILGLRALGAASLTPWNFVWYGLDPAFPSEAVALDPDPSSAGIKTQRIGANSVSLNYSVLPGRPLDPAIPDRYRPNAAFPPMRQAYAAQAAFLREQDNNFFAGQTITRHVDVFNDVSEPASFRLEWSLGDLASGKIDLDMDVYEHKPVVLYVQSSEIQKGVTVPFRLELRNRDADGSDAAVHTTSIDYWIEPGTKGTSGFEDSGEALFLIDSLGETARVFDTLGIPFLLIESDGIGDSEKWKDADAPVLVVGRGQMKDATLHACTQSLRAAGFFERGGVLVALENSFAKDVDAPLNPVEREAMRAWRRAAPAFWSSIPDDTALRYWSQDGTVPWMNGAVARTLYRKPIHGAFVPVAEVADGGEGLEYTPLLWLPLDRGGVAVNGFSLIDNAGRHPAAAAILRKLTSVTPTDFSNATDPSGIAFFGTKDAGLAYVTDRSGVERTDDAKAHFIVLEGATPHDWKNADVASLKGRLSDGARVIVTTVTPETLEFARKLSGLELELQTGPWENVAKAKGRELDPALEGISQDDLMWVRRGQWETICTTAFLPVDGLEPLVETVDVKWAGYAEAAEQYKYAMMLRRRAAFPGPRTVVGRVRVGKGELILSQLEIGTARIFTSKAHRIWSRLLRNAGARFAADSSPLLQRRSPYVDENGFIRRWLLLGVFGGVEPDRLLSHDFSGGEADLDPREGKETAGKTWMPYTAVDPAVDLRDAFKDQPLENVAAYLAVHVHSPRSRDIILDTPDMVDLAVGSDDGVRAWLNGEQILKVDAVRPWAADQDRVRGVKLRKGWNLLLLKVSQHGGDWKASARFLTSSGFPVSDLAYSLSP